MEISISLQQAYIETASQLKGHERRRFMAQVVMSMGAGGQRYAEREFGWNRGTVRKGIREVKSGQVPTDSYHLRGRKPAESLLPNLLPDIKAILEKDKLLSAPRVRFKLITEKGYQDTKLPTTETIRRKINFLRSQGLLPANQVQQ